MAGLVVIGLSAGILHTAIFHAISPMYRHDPAATINMAGILFGLGCLTVALLVSGTFYAYSAPAIQTWIAVIPGLFGWFYVRTKFTAQPMPVHPPLRAILANSQSWRGPVQPVAVLSIWKRMGDRGMAADISEPALGNQPGDVVGDAGGVLAGAAGRRIVAQWVLPRVSHTKLLVLSVRAAIFGCVIMLSTENRFGAVSGVLLLGAAFAPIYPLLVEKIGQRFPYYHPGFYNGLFSFAIAGGLLAPCTLGYFASLWGVRVVMGLPLAGSAVVFLLLALISLEARLSSATRR